MLENYQFEMELDKIYELNNFEDVFKFRTPSLFILTGEVDIYTKEGTAPANKSEMHLEHEGVSGHQSFSTIPKYIYIEESTATVTDVIITGIEPTEV